MNDIRELTTDNRLLTTDPRAKLRLSPLPQDFIWATGIEDTFVPQARPGYRPLDEYELIGHYEHWKEDLPLARDLGMQAIRWGVPWYRVEIAPGEFDWSWIDRVLPYIVEDLGITPIVDLMHYGCPLWLAREFANPEYPQRVASYAAAFARRYSHLVRWYTPLNEPLINALMCGKRGQWPPYMRGDRGYIRVLVQLVKGILSTVQAIKEIDPNAIMVHVDATGLTHAMREDLEVVSSEEQVRRFMGYDLITGRVNHWHPLFSWLVRNGISPDELANIAQRGITLDLIGMNFYPQWSTKQLYINREGRLATRLIEKSGEGFATLIQTYYDRYKAPIIITETSARNSNVERTRWLETSVRAIRQLRGQGVPVYGYTWFPLFTMIDWRYRLGQRPAGSYRLELGLYRLNKNEQGPRWVATPLVRQIRSYIANPEASVGALEEGQLPDDRRPAIRHRKL